MTKEELEKYAHENRKRLDAQEVKIGDVVKVLRGQFAGETGVIVGIIVCGRDYADPYYEVDMDCDVPEKYKCRKSLISKNNVIGGLSAYEFEVIGNRAPMQSTEEIKVGDKVKVAKNAPKVYIAGVRFVFTEIASTVTKIDYPENNPKDQTLRIEITPFNFMEIPSIYVERVENEEQTEAEKTDTDNIVDNFTKVMEGYRKVFADIADNFDWQRYEADLAKEIAVKLSKPNENKPGYVADYAVSVAKSVVENLKKK